MCSTFEHSISSNPAIMSKSASIDSTSSMINDQGLLPEELVEVPTFLHSPNCDSKLIQQTRQILKQRFAEQPDHFYHFDIELIMSDDWAVSRFLLRCRNEPKRAADLMEASSKFRRQFKMGEAKPHHFPLEMHEVGGIFKYAPDRVGNTTMWMRAKLHRRSAEMVTIMKQFILCVMEQCDKESKGRGVAVVFDLSQCGIRNADPTFLYWLLNSFRTYMPKGLSYIIVYNLPWVLSATCSMAMSWLSSTNRKRLRFIEGDEIFKFIAPENLPDFVQGGSCKLDYKLAPQDSEPVEAQPDHKLVPITEGLAQKIRHIHGKLTTCDEN